MERKIRNETLGPQRDSTHARHGQRQVIQRPRPRGHRTEMFAYA